MVECQLPKLDVAGSSPVSRSINSVSYNSLLAPAWYDSTTLASLKPLIESSHGTF